MQQEQKRIMARFRPQAWIRDEATDIDDGQSDFDVTRLIAAMPLRELQQLEDDEFSSDDLARRAGLLARHSGPFVVEVEDALRAYFGVETMAEITQSQLNALKRACAGEQDNAFRLRRRRRHSMRRSRSGV
ncbi:MAG TPA: hypothetical protein VFA48_06135 [Gammaproteobacteria bacterium]|nr:hypothetical protein [Gammaproteobacteria bacterium]